jgi:hypothetical protein
MIASNAITTAVAHLPYGPRVRGMNPVGSAASSVAALGGGAIEGGACSMTATCGRGAPSEAPADSNREGGRALRLREGVAVLVLLRRRRGLRSNRCYIPSRRPAGTTP